MKIKKCSTVTKPVKQTGITWDEMCKQEGIYVITRPADGPAPSYYFLVLHNGTADVTVLYYNKEILQPAESHWKFNNKFVKTDKSLCVEVCD